MIDTLMSELNLDGFQLVSGNLFSTLSAPTMTIWPDSISFSQTAYIYFGQHSCSRVWDC